MFSAENMGTHGLTKPDGAGEYFVDRNGRYFECILDFYRSGQIIVPASIPILAIREEISFFQLPVDERQVMVQGEMWADRIAKIALGRALDNARPILDRLMEHITTALNAAADRGCWKTTIDVCSTKAYVRTSGGIVKKEVRGSITMASPLWSQGASEDIQEPTEAPTSAPQWHYNLIDGSVARWLANNDNRRLLETHLAKENFRFTLKRELSFFVLCFHLFDLPQIQTLIPSSQSALSSSSVDFSSKHSLSTSPDSGGY